jgi:hypothetical protein
MGTAGPAGDPSPRTSPGDLVRAMVKANRLASTHVRTVLAHTVDQRGVLDDVLSDDVVRELIGVDIHETATVEAFVCHLLGTTFHGLTFSMASQPDGALPVHPNLVVLDPGKPEDGPIGRVADELAPASFARSDAPRRAWSVFDGTANDEYLIQLPDHAVARPAVPAAGARAGHEPHISFRQAAAKVAHLATQLERPLSFVHAPVSAPTRHDVPRRVTGPCLRVGVAFPRFDDRQRLRFGTELVDLCCRESYGLWQREAIAGMAEHDYWQPVVRLPPPANLRLAETFMPRPDDHALAVTFVGTAVPGATEAILKVLARANAPVAALAVTTLDDMGIIHLLTRTRLSPAQIADLEAGQRADVALGAALGVEDPPLSDRLGHFRALFSTRPEVPPGPDLAAVWLAWATPATPDALRLTVRTLREALDAVWHRYRFADGPAADERHLNIEYLVGREVSDDWLRGRMKVAIDLRALGALAEPDGTISRAGIGQFCSDVERRWRSRLTAELRTTNIDLDVVWRESWIGRWTSMHLDPRDERDIR